MTTLEVDSIGSLLGEELSAVCFVRNYVELQFDGPLLRCLGSIAIIAMGENKCTSSHFPLEKDNDLLAFLLKNIGRVVASINLFEGKEIHIEFDNGVRVLIGPREHGGEYAHFISYPGNRMTVFD